MSSEVTFAFCGADERRSSDVSEMRRVVQQLTAPKATLITNVAGWSGYLDFQVLEDRRIEMEIMERTSDFATVDILIAAQVMEIVMTDTRSLPLRQKLSGLQIEWLT